MRASILVSILASVLVAACGGDDGGSGNNDAGGSGSDGSGSAGCDVMGSYTSADAGTMAAPLENDWFYKPTTGQLAGRTLFSLIGSLPGSTQTSTDELEIDVLKPNTGATPMFPLNTPQVFGSGAIFGIYANLDLTNMSAMPSQVYLATTGSITFTAIGEADGALITGSITAADLSQVNASTGMPIAGGCTTSATAFNFYLKQKAAAPLLPQPGGSDVLRSRILSQ